MRTPAVQFLSPARGVRARQGQASGISREGGIQGEEIGEGRSRSELMRGRMIVVITIGLEPEQSDPERDDDLIFCIDIHRMSGNPHPANSSNW